MRTRFSISKIGGGVFLGAVFFFLFAPLLLVVLFSFHSAARMSFPFDGFSLHWYEVVFNDSLVVDAMARSAFAAILAGLVAATLGLTVALAIIGMRDRVKVAVIFAAMIPLTFPTLLYAIGLAILYQWAGVGFSLGATIAGHVIVGLPFVFLVIGAALDRFRLSLLEAARDLGANAWFVFWRVTFPLILPAILGATLLAMALSLDEFTVAFFTAGQEKTLPLLLYGRINQGLDPSLNAMGTIMLLATTALALLGARQTAKERSL